MAAPQLPMPHPTVPRKPLLSFKLLSFDIYGTLIDWETFIHSHLQTLSSRIPSSSPQAPLKNDERKVQQMFNAHQIKIQEEQPSLRYDILLKEAYLASAKELSINDSGELKQEAENFGNSIGEWKAFPDTVAACQRLSRFYKLVPLSNVDRASFSKTCQGPLHGVDFWRSYVAEEIGSYKPDLRNFEYLIQHVKEESIAESPDGQGIGKDEILHTAQSLFHDHVPAKKMGMSSVWIARQGQGTGMGDYAEEVHKKGEVGYGWRFGSLGEMADAVEREAAEAEAGQAKA